MHVKFLFIFLHALIVMICKWGAWMRTVITCFREFTQHIVESVEQWPTVFDNIRKEIMAWTFINNM